MASELPLAERPPSGSGRRSAGLLPRRSAEEGERDEDRARSLDRQVTLLELVVVLAAVVFGLLGLVSLGAAHLGDNTPGVIFPIWIVSVVVVVAAVWIFDRPSLRLDRPGLLVGVLASGLAAVLFFPGFQYATGDKDPGVYVAIAAEIQRWHSLPFPDPLTAASLPGVAVPLSVQQTWPGLWSQPGHFGMIFPQFYHLWPALLVASKDVGGWTALFDTGPLLGVIGVAGSVAIARRVAGLTGAAVAGAILATNMIQVWQSKYPSSEIYDQLLFVGALLGAVVAVRTGWKSAAALSGLLLGLGYLERADGIVVVLIAWGMLSALLAVRRFDWRAGWMAIGILALLPYGFYQAYDLAKTYTLTNNVPPLRDMVAILVALPLVAAALAWHGGLARLVFGKVDEGRRRRLGVAFVALCAVLMVIGFLRLQLFGRDFQVQHGVLQRTYDEVSLIRLSWFFSLIGFALLGAGIVWVACRRWRTENWIVALVTLPLLALYAWHSHNSPYLMWDFRRFVTSVIPGMAILIGCGVAWCVIVLRRWLPPAAVGLGVVAITVYFAVFGLTQSWPLRHHDEAAGSVGIAQDIGALAGPGRTGLFFWAPDGSCCDQPYLLFGGPVMSIAGQESALAPTDPGQLSGLLEYYLKRPDAATRPVFYVGNGTTPGVTVPGVTLRAVKQFSGVLQHWAETYSSRPKGDANYTYDFTVYRASLSSR